MQTIYRCNVSFSNLYRVAWDYHLNTNLMITTRCRVLKRGGVKFKGNPKDSKQEDWVRLGKIRGITTPP